MRRKAQVDYNKIIIKPWFFLPFFCFFYYFVCPIDSLHDDVVIEYFSQRYYVGTADYGDDDDGGADLIKKAGNTILQQLK